MFAGKRSCVPLFSAPVALLQAAGSGNLFHRGIVYRVKVLNRTDNQDVDFQRRSKLVELFQSHAIALWVYKGVRTDRIRTALPHPLDEEPHRDLLQGIRRERGWR